MELMADEFVDELNRLGEHFDKLGEHELIWGTRLPYAATHQYGDEERNIAQREFLAVTPECVEQCQEIVINAINDERTPIEALKECREPIAKSISGNFTAAESAAGDPWPARKDPLPTHPLLILSGDLYLSSTSSFGPDHIEEIS